MKRNLFVISVFLNALFLIAGLIVVQKLGGINYLIFKMKNRGLAGTYEHRKNLFEMMPAQDSTIVFLGNSLTAQNEWAEMFGNPKIVNRGIPGDGTEGVLSRLELIFKTKPAKIFLMIGINDLLFYKPPRIIDNYKKIVGRIQEESPQTTLYIQSLLPINNRVRNTSLDNETIRQINVELKKLAHNNQLIFIDLYPLFTDKEGNLNADFTNDGIHINGEAYLVWKEEIEQYVK